jgi:hypothetical protein
MRRGKKAEAKVGRARKAEGVYASAGMEAKTLPALV